MSKPKPIGLSLDEVAGRFIDAAKQEVDNSTSEVLQAYIRKHGRLEAVKLLLGNDPIQDKENK